MTNAKLLIPLRIPELGPALGKLIAGTGSVTQGFSLEPSRHLLATKVIEMGGEARRLAASGERATALACLSRDAWLAVWEEAVAPVATRFVDRLSAHLLAEAAAVRMPRRIRERIAIDEMERRAIGARLGSSGAGLIPVLDEIEARSAALVDATGLERGALAGWQRAQTTAARRLEEAWLLLERRVGEELATWQGVADETSRWRKPWWPVVLVGVVGIATALWVGLMLGGVLSPPSWLAALWQGVR
jgi:hypothetical protein